MFLISCAVFVAVISQLQQQHQSHRTKVSQIFWSRKTNVEECNVFVCSQHARFVDRIPKNAIKLS